MPENRMNSPLSVGGRGTVCIDTNRVLDCCRDRDCFEDTRVYLTPAGEDVIAGASAVRTKEVKTLWAYVGVDEVPFNNGFFRVTVRYYISVLCEACVGIGKSANVAGLAVLEKEVVLYGGQGNVVSYSSSPENNFCNIVDSETVGNNGPTVIIETVEPVVLSTKIECKKDPCGKFDFAELPEIVRRKFDGELVLTSSAPHLYVSFGLFSIIRIQRPCKILVQAMDYSVPDKECIGNSPDSPCDLFHALPFPTDEFGIYSGKNATEKPKGPCGCKG